MIEQTQIIPSQVLLKETRTFEKYQRDTFSFGRYTYGEPAIVFPGSGVQLRVGSFCSLSNTCTFILGGNHRHDWVSTYPFPNYREAFPHAYGQMPTSKGDITVGHDVWVGSYSYIFSGVTIGDGAVIGACAVVAKDVPPYAVVVGNPGKVIKYRFPPEQIAALQRIRWWEWEKEKIDAEMAYFCSDRIAEFIARHDPGA